MFSRDGVRTMKFRAIGGAVVVLGMAAMMGGCESNVEHYRKEGITLYGQQKYDQSLVSLNKALTYDEFDGKSNAYAGLVHYRAGEYVPAAYHFKLALQAD